MGQALTISLPSPLAKDQNVELTIHYATTSECPALQWLSKEYSKYLHAAISSKRTTGRRLETSLNICLVNVSLSMLEASSRYKVSASYSRINYSNVKIDSPSVKIVRFFCLALCSTNPVTDVYCLC